MKYICWVCKKEYIYNKSYNNHLYKKHKKEMYKIETEPIDIQESVFGIELLKAINEEALYYIEISEGYGTNLSILR
jgi:hypothetical protein